MAMLGRFTRVATSTVKRSFSTTAAVKDALERPPIQLFGIDGRYAHALFSATVKSNALPAVGKDMTRIKSLLASDDVFNGFLNTPILSRKDKTAAVTDLLTKMKFSPTTVNFFAAMAENNRLAMTSDIVGAFDTLMTAHRNEVKCVVTSAEPLDKTTIANLTASLKGFTSEGQSVNVSTQIDESILGGLIVEVGDKYIDMSVLARVNKMMQTLQAPI